MFQERYSGAFMLYVFPAVLVFCKMNMFLLTSLPNMIIDCEQLSRWVGGSPGKWSVVGWQVVSVVHGFNKTQEKNLFGVKISSMHFGRDLFCCSNFILFYIDNTEKANLTARNSHSNLLFLKIHKCCIFKENKSRVYWNFNKYLLRL